MQASLAQANVSVDIERSRAEAAKARAQGEAAVITTTGEAEATRTRAIGSASASAEEALGLARAKGFDAQRRAIGAEQTALVAALREVGSGHVKIVPDVQVGGDSGVVGGLGALLMRNLASPDRGALPATPLGDGNGVGPAPEPVVDEEDGAVADAVVTPVATPVGPEAAPPPPDAEVLPGG
jgi:hypothetical protein